MIDLDTLIVMIYVFVDDWYQQNIAPMKAKRGRPSQFSDSEALTIAIVSEWRAGVSWRSERGCLRYLHQHYGDWFPNLPQRSAFNERKRGLLGILNQLDQMLSEFLATKEDLYECVDSLPIPAGTLGQYSRDKGHWLWNSTIGRGKGGWFWGDHMLASVCPSEVITGWLLVDGGFCERKTGGRIHDRATSPYPRWLSISSFTPCRIYWCFICCWVCPQASLPGR